MKNTTEQIIDVTPERVDIVSHVSPKEKVIMLVVACALIALAYTASRLPSALYTNTTVITPAVTKQISYRKLDGKSIRVGDTLPVKGYLKSSVDNSLTALKNSMEQTSKTIEKQKALHSVEAAFYKSHFQNEPLSPQESRKLLLKAGFKPQEPQVVAAKQAKESHKDGVAFSHGIAKELIRDEVEGFFLKVKLATQVGEYLLSD
jgi:hypothetical protein